MPKSVFVHGLLSTFWQRCKVGKVPKSERFTGHSWVCGASESWSTRSDFSTVAVTFAKDFCSNSSNFAVVILTYNLSMSLSLRNILLKPYRNH